MLLAYICLLSSLPQVVCVLFYQISFENFSKSILWQCGSSFAIVVSFCGWGHAASHYLAMLYPFLA